MLSKLRIGTRGSQLALTQAHMVADALRQAHADIEIEIVKILTTGDWQPDQGETRLSEEDGGKGLFAKEIEKAILKGAVDCGVHSMKDMPSFLPEGLVAEHVLPREDPRDAFLSNEYKTVADMKPGASVGTSSLRRQAMILALRPDLNIVPFRGNVPTRIEKLRAGRVDATILALSGLKRLGLEKEVASVMELDDMLPAAGQGVVGIETREGDKKIHALLTCLHCRETGWRLAAERAALQVLDGSCHTPIGAYASLDDQEMHLKVVVLSEDGQQVYEEENRCSVTTIDEAQALGLEIGAILKERLPEGILS